MNAVETLIDATVETRHGRVRGAVVDGVCAFKGIPYAAPPFGANRFRPPQPPEPWGGTRDALEFGPKVPQVPFPPPWDVLLKDEVDIGEDCLTLNVWSRDLATADQPVIVWIPGGMFESGTAAMRAYDGSRFARDGVVCVTINYRVGAEGFLHLAGETANVGLLDQLAALEWVRENIAGFGGDAGNVTVVGESAGAMSIGTMMAMPRAAGLFRRAIVESGGAHMVASLQTAAIVARSLAARLGIEPTREAFAAVPVERMLIAEAELKAELTTNPDPTRWGMELLLTMLPWQPVVDGEVIPARPIDRITEGVGATIDLMVGSNLDESNFFLVPGGMIDQIAEPQLAMMAAAYGLEPEPALSAYRALRPGAGVGELFSTIQTDWLFRIPALRMAEAHAKHRAASTYMYEFAWRSKQYGGRLGACHGLEIPFAFDTLPESDPHGEPDPLLGADVPRALARTMHAAWVSFASYGFCDWPPFDLATRATMRFDTISSVVNDPLAAQRAVWVGVR
ncbi:MAG TPA: carboxylesterase/lipase family protein [Candidatus Kapabacteria bacterium]|nr:carboxylesterase/lipase family protein [Candidatus Kapabacteria bacterium]